MEKKTLLFNPGPTNVSERVRNALKTKDICHREKEFSDVLTSVRSKVLKIVNGEGTHTAVVFVCSGTGCNESIISGIHGKILLIKNGKYSERLQGIIEKFNIPSVTLNFDPFKQIDLKKLEDALEEHDDITHILMVHHETTTGMLLPLHEIGQLAKKYNKILVADTISSLGGYRIDVKNDNLAFCTVSANKCLQSFPGISFVIARKSELETMKGESRSLYFDLFKQWEYEEKKHQTPFTPAVQLFFALNEALDELLEEGIENRINRYKKNANRMREGLKKLGFKFILPDDLQSNILTAIHLPKEMDYWKVHDRLKGKGYTIYSGQETLDKGIFRVATLGHLKEEDINSFLNVFKDVLDELNLKPKEI